MGSFCVAKNILNNLIKYVKLIIAKPIEDKMRGNFCFLQGYYSLLKKT